MKRSDDVRDQDSARRRTSGRGRAGARAERQEELNLGAGNQESDPATAEDPPGDLKAGDEKRNPA